MLKAYLNLLFLVILCSSLKTQIMSRQLLDHFKQHPDFTNHLIFFHQPTFKSIEDDLQIWEDQADIKFYINDCKGNHLPECDNSQENPLVLMYNRVLIKYNGDPKNFKDLKEWIEVRIVQNAKIITNEKQLNDLINANNNVFCLCTNDQLSNDQAIFLALAKELPFLNYCVIRNEIFYKTLGLKFGNLTYFKNSTENRVEFQYPNRLDAWEWFVKNNMIPNIPRVSTIVNERFAQKQKLINAYIVTCDFSYTCEKVWKKINQFQSELTNQHLGFDFYIAIQDQKESFTFNLYYHFTFDMKKLPAYIHINLRSESERAGDLVRHLHYIENREFSIESLKHFKSSIIKGQIEPFFFSDEIPKKKGFTGKGSEKLIQKIVAKNYEQVINSSPNHYILLITALHIGCNRCDEFYNQFKQIASLLVDKDVTFGYLNVNKNEISLQKVVQMPDLFLFKKDNKTNPVRLEIPLSFDHLRNFIRDELGNEYYDPDQL